MFVRHCESKVIMMKHGEMFDLTLKETWLVDDDPLKESADT